MKKVLAFALFAFALTVPVVQARTARAAPDNVYAGQTDQGLPAYIKVLSHNRGVEAVFAYAAKCDDGTVAMLWGGATKLVPKRGHFRFARAEDSNGPEITLDGRLGKSSVSGTWNASFTDHAATGAVTDHCDSGLVHWTLQRSKFGGQSSGGYPVALAVGKNKVTLIQMVTAMKCQSGDYYYTATPYADFAVASNGAFGDSFTDTGSPGQGLQADLTITIHGKLGRAGAKGTWRVIAVVKDASGNQVDSCDSGPMTWHADR